MTTRPHREGLLRLREWLASSAQILTDEVESMRARAVAFRLAIKMLDAEFMRAEQADRPSHPTEGDDAG